MDIIEYNLVRKTKVDIYKFKFDLLDTPLIQMRTLLRYTIEEWQEELVKRDILWLCRWKLFE